MLLQYKDEDGDLVQISTDAELAYALQFYATNTNPRVLRLQFALRQWRNKKCSPEDNQSSRDLCTPNDADVNHKKVSTTRALPMKKLQEGTSSNSPTSKDFTSFFLRNTRKRREKKKKLTTTTIKKRNARRRSAKRRHLSSSSAPVRTTPKLLIGSSKKSFQRRRKRMTARTKA